MATTDTTAELNPGTHPPHATQITVNGQPVEMTSHRVTGLEVKEAAIAGGVPIQLDFQLSVKRGGHYDLVGDSDPIEIHRGEEFLAVAPDDNS
jgi:hypothetical protein